MDFEFKAFPLTHHSRYAWDSLLCLNEGGSAPWITEAPGTSHCLYVCCLVLNSEPKRKQIDGEESVVETFKNEEWGIYYSRIAIIVPVAVQSGIAMAQGIRRLYATCSCEHLKRLGITLLAHTVRHFDIEYLFLSPIHSFGQHLRRELEVRKVTFGTSQYRSLWWAMRNTESTIDGIDPASSWIDIRSSSISYTKKDKFLDKDAVMLTITPQRAPTIPRRVLLLNEGFYFSQCRDIDPYYEPPPPLPLETHDFLWFIAGDGVMVVHGPSLAASHPGTDSATR